jgi:hypothetical protein
MTNAIDIKLKEIAVANGAPIKPRAIGSGPHTESQGEWLLSSDIEEQLSTEYIVQNRVERRNYKDDLSRDREEAL